MADALYILRASYEGVTFPVLSAKTTISHDAAGHKVYRRRGTDWEPTGENADEGSLTIPLFDGVDGMTDLWPGTYRRLIAAVRANPIGTLTHPTRGALRVLVHKLEESAEADARNGVVLSLIWSAHNGGRAVAQTEFATSGSQAAAVAAAQAADAALLALGVQSLLASTVADTIDSITAQVSLTVGMVETAFSTMLLAAQAYMETDVVTAASGYPALSALAFLSRTLRSTRDVYLPGSAKTRVFTVTRPMSVLDVALEVYGDATRAQEILKANALSDPMNLAPGRTLVLRPDQIAAERSAGA